MSGVGKTRRSEGLVGRVARASLLHLFLSLRFLPPLRRSKAVCDLFFAIFFHNLSTFNISLLRNLTPHIPSCRKVKTRLQLDLYPRPSPSFSICFRVAETSLTIASSPHRIARNVKFFETWCSYNGLEQVAFSDLSNAFRTDALSVFDVKGKLPETLVDRVCLDIILPATSYTLHSISSRRLPKA